MTSDSAMDISTKESTTSSGTKRSASVAGSNTSNRPIKRRASKACQCCRARKVRCNVVEHGAPCTNCRLDNVECVITESKRRSNAGEKLTKLKKNKQLQKSNQPASPSSSSHEELPDDKTEQIPTFTYPKNSLESIPESHHRRKSSSAKTSAPFNRVISQQPSPSNSSATSHPIRVPTYEILTKDLPSFIKPAPTRIPEDDVDYLVKKGATSIPLEPFRTELIECYFAYVHPFNPLIEETEWRKVCSRNWDAFDPNRHKDDRISLLLYQAVLFAGSAFVRMESLRAAGYNTRKSARKAFFQRTRLLYDFDWEQDRISLIQAILLMTYWYETPDDQKDTWHWMGVAISLSQTVGLHRNPANSNLSERRQKHWKRIWWSSFIRDRMVALGMRRPTRIKDEDCDVPMLTLEDFGIEEDEGLSEVYMGGDAEQYREKRRQRTLALLCIEKAKLCVIVGKVLAAQYSAANSIHAKDGYIDTTKNMMLLQPKKAEVEVCDVRLCDDLLTEWQRQLCPEAVWRPANNMLEDVDPFVILHRNMLHMVYYTTVSALHRPQVLPSAPAPWPARNRGPDFQEMSRKKVRHAAHEITRLAEELIEFDLVRFLSTVGVTVVLPALIIHLLDIKSSSAVTRELSLQGFSLCMQVMQGLRDIYAAADFATHFLEAAVKKANIQIPAPTRQRFATSDDAIKALNQRRTMLFKRGVEIMQDNLLVPRSEGILGNVDMGVSVSVGTETPRDDSDADMSIKHHALREKLEQFLTENSDGDNGGLMSADEDHIHVNMDLQDMLLNDAHDIPIQQESPVASELSHRGFSGSELSDSAMHDIDGLFVNDNDPFLGAYDGVPGIGEGTGFGLDLMIGGHTDDGMNGILDDSETGFNNNNEHHGRLMDGAMDFDFDKVMEGLETNFLEV